MLDLLGTAVDPYRKKITKGTSAHHPVIKESCLVRLTECKTKPNWSVSTSRGADRLVSFRLGPGRRLERAVRVQGVEAERPAEISRRVASARHEAGARAPRPPASLVGGRFRGAPVRAARLPRQELARPVDRRELPRDVVPGRGPGLRVSVSLCLS